MQFVGDVKSPTLRFMSMSTQCSISYGVKCSIEAAMSMEKVHIVGTVAS